MKTKGIEKVIITSGAGFIGSQTANLLKELTDKGQRVSVKDWRPADQKVYISDIRKAQEKLGWTPTINPKQGVKQLINWVSQNKHLFIK